MAVGTSEVVVEFKPDTSRAVAVLDAIGRHAEALASELRGLNAEAGSETIEDKPDAYVNRENGNSLHCIRCEEILGWVEAGTHLSELLIARDVHTCATESEAE